MSKAGGCFTFVVSCTALMVGAAVYFGGAGERAPPDGVHLSSDGQEIIVAGEFVPGLEKQFRRMIDSASDARVVRLFSIGGYVAVAGKIRNDIRERGLDTAVSGLCASACTIAFMAGQRRILTKGGRLGFHSFSLHGRQSDQTTQEMELHYGYFGLRDDFVARIGQTPATSIWYPSTRELLNAHVVTDIAKPASWRPW